MPRSARHVLAVLPVAAALLAVSSEASAQITGSKEDSLPVPFARRPLTLPHMVLAPEGTLSFTHVDLGGFFGAGNGAALELGGSFGLLGDIELEATIISLAMGDGSFAPTGGVGANDFDWGVSRFGATVRFVASDAFEMGGLLRLMLDNRAVIGINFGLPMRIHGGEVVRLDTGIYGTGLVNQPGIFGLGGGDAVFSFATADSNPLGMDPGIPLDLYINAIPELFFNLGTGFGVLDVSEDQSIFIPLELGVGGTIPSSRREPLVDIFASFAFPVLFLPASDGDQALTNLWQIGLGAKGFIPLGG